MYDVPIHLLHVTEQIVLPTAYGIQPPTMDSEALREAAREAIAPHASDLEAQGRTVHVHLREGHPAQEILATAEGSSGAPLIALSTHGRTGLKRLLLGSVAEKVIRRAPCPVFVVKAFGRSLVSDADAATASSASPED
jgi:nucleotide-binding universal stress UspA family protein